MSSHPTRSDPHCADAVSGGITPTGELERRLRRQLAGLKRTPLHPQWLLRRSRSTSGMIRRYAKGRVLDIGCADTRLKNDLPAECEYIGLDYPPTGKILYDARPDVFADAANLPIADSSIDTVILFEVLEHVRAPQQALSEVARVLRPGGSLLLTMPFLYPIHDAPHDFQRYTMYGLSREIENAGLRRDVLEPSLGAAETAGVLAALTLGGMALEAVRRRHFSVLLLPLLLAAIPIVNVLAWTAGRVFPSWSAVSLGYHLRATRT